ncbi:multiple sugar transport system substrate-binding protein [Lihuaxuella thermophila]|uniref:Multiple sugar transport system substrate-binding protein n=2 Tax=Lihuaxuella thermophila TaxID=1173111 RepID=A0A1H8EVU4_9BACL|nr:multiple sugar transport system substrate-binding protein [Lihuaxuella thermophila]
MKGRFMKKIVTGLLASSLLVGMAGCSGDPGGSSASGKVELKIGTWAGAQELKEFQGIVDQLNQQSKNYHLTIQSIPADYYKKIQTMAAAKQAPDLFWLSQEYIPMYAELGVIAPLDEYIKGNSKLNLDDYFEGPLQVGKVNGKLYGLPWINQPVMLYYNKTLFEKTGVELPKPDWTWEDFEKAAIALTKDVNQDGKTDQFGTVIDGWPPVALWVWTHGGEIIDKDGKVRMDEPQAIEGIKMFHKLINQDKVTPNKTQAQNTGGPEMFKTGKVAMFFGGAGDDFEKQVGNAFEVGMTKVPHATTEATFSWIAATVMSNTTKNKPVAAEALIDLTNAIRKWKILPPTKSGLGHVADIRPEKAYAVEIMTESSKVSRGFNNQSKQNELDTAIWQELYEPILLGKKSPEQAAKDAANALRKILGQ